jgi:ATP-binding cassette subfamily B protein
METTNVKQKKKEKPQYNMWQNSGWMIKNAWKERKSVLFLSLAVAAGAVAMSLTELFIAPMVLRKVETSAPLSQLLGTILGFALLLMFLSALNAYLDQNTMFGRMEGRLSILKQVHYKFDTTSFPNTENPVVLKKLEKAQMAMNCNDSSTEAIWKTMTDLLKNGAGFLIYLCLLSSLDPVLLVVVLVTTVVGYFSSKRIHEWGYRHREEEAAYLKKINYIWFNASERKIGKDIRMFGMRPWLEDVYRSALTLYHDFIARRERVYLIADVIDVVLSLLRNGISYFYLITLTLKSGLPASQFLLYFNAVNGFTNWMTGILTGLSTLHTQSLDLSTIREFLELSEPFLFEKGKPIQAEPGASYEIKLNNVSFRYPGVETDTIHQMDLTIHAGEKLAIVGLNGAGKTTLVKLICGFYDPTEGEVLLNGVNIKTYNRRDYYNMFTAVFQQFSVMDITLAENVAQTVESVDLERVKTSVAKAGLTQKAESLPQGYDTHIGRQVFEDGIELSGGETQRLMLARALYKGAPMMVLDEPTAALDPIAENDMYLKYNEMTKGCTSVYISHRLASTRFCDRIIFLANGKIAEEGTHDALIDKNGEYAKLFAIQSKYYQEGDVLDEKEERSE